MAAPAPNYVEITPEPEWQRILSLLRRLVPCDPMGAADVYEALRPYLEPAGGGGVYVFLQPNKEITVQAGTAPLGEEIDALDAKVGYAVDVEARREGHEQQCVGVERAWAYYYPTRYPKLLEPERLVQLTLKALGAHRTPRPCTGYFCNVRHWEFFAEGAAGGLEGIAAIIKGWIRRLGEIPDRRPMYYTN
ncbi:hypothetical protein FB451DRAFT_1166207 [Mycena latifolia]|nr:hypothetical protein FB451DRAFT_1166207 [Mycena latifolia]